MKNDEIFSMSTLDQEHTSSMKPVKILLIEDDCISQMVAKMMLQQMGYQVTATDQGRIALSIYQEFDLIVSDIGLPDIDGLEICQTIRAASQKNTIPMIALTAQPQHVDLCFAKGFNRFMTKPVEYETLQQTIASLLAEINQ